MPPRCCLGQHYCKPLKENTAYVDYNMLRRFTSDRGKIRARRVTVVCPQHQRETDGILRTSHVRPFFSDVR
jgi:ribosomal protein S18